MMDCASTRVVRALEQQTDKASIPPDLLHEHYYDGRKVTLMAFVAEGCDLREQVGSLTNDLKSKILELRSSPALITKAAQLPQERSEAQKEINTGRAELASLGEVVDKISAIKKI